MWQESTGKASVGVAAAEIWERCTGSASPVFEDFSSPGAGVLLVSRLCLLARHPGQLSCFAIYKQLCVQKFPRIYNVMVLCESSALGTELADLSV